ncbi:MAG TPA: glycosyltransferase, partial [Ignavibacteria bacterium]|nr:glycosyltransferase [Ignavibacteria bacterium]
MAILPLFLVSSSKSSKFAIGNGQFMFFKRSFYDKIGGHESLKNRIVEDVWLAKRVKEFGGNLVFADGTDIAKCRMYRNFNEIWSGFSKNFFAGLSFSFAGLILLDLFYLIIFILPVFTFFYGISASNSVIVYCSLFSVLIPILIRISHSIKFKQSFYASFLNILSSVMIILLSLNSYRIIKFGIGANWKGRRYKESVIK